MDILKISLNEYADIPFLKKLLSQIKGVSDVEFFRDNQSFSWDEVENSEDFRKVLEKSFEEIEQGNYRVHSKELMDEIFKK